MTSIEEAIEVLRAYVSGKGYIFSREKYGVELVSFDKVINENLLQVKELSFQRVSLANSIIRIDLDNKKYFVRPLDKYDYEYEDMEYYQGIFEHDNKFDELFIDVLFKFMKSCTKLSLGGVDEQLPQSTREYELPFYITNVKWCRFTRSAIKLNNAFLINCEFLICEPYMLLDLIHHDQFLDKLNFYFHFGPISWSDLQLIAETYGPILKDLQVQSLVLNSLDEEQDFLQKIEEYELNADDFFHNHRDFINKDFIPKLLFEYGPIYKRRFT